MTQPKSYRGRGLAEGNWTHAKTTAYGLGAYSSFAARARSALHARIYTSYESMRRRGGAHASDKLRWWGRQPGPLGGPAAPLGRPPAPPPRSPSPQPFPWQELGLGAVGAALRLAARWQEQPGLNAGVAPARVGCGRPSRAEAPPRGAPGCQPPGHLRASAALPCSSPAPKQALGSSGGSRAPPPSGALRFFDIWSVFGS